MEHLTREEIKGYWDRMTGANALVKADRHLAGCAVCRNELHRTMSAPALPALVAEMPEPVHLSYEEMTGYIDAKVDATAREGVEEHVAICRSCAKELKELQAFDTRLAHEMNPVVVEERVIETGPGWFEQMRQAIAEFFATPARLGFAGGGIGLMLLGIFSLLQIQKLGTGADQKGAQVMAHITLFSAAENPHLFYGGFIVVGLGLLALVYGLLKRGD